MLSEQLRALARAQGVSLYTVLLSGFYILLHRYTQELDLMIGTPLANRHYEQIEHLIGFFVNTLVLRVQLRPEHSVKAIIETVHATLIEAQEHQDLPFEKLVERLQVAQDPSRHPLVQVLFSVQSFGEKIAQDLFKFESLTEYYKVAKFDLSVLIDDGEPKLRGVFNYATHLYDRETINRVKEHYLLILAELVQGPDKALREISGMSQAEYKKIVYHWNETHREYPEDKTLVQLFEAQATQTPENTAVVYAGETLSYRELNARSNQLARYIRRMYLEQNQAELMPDTLIAICVERSLEMIIGILGILKAGAAYVPMDPDSPPERLHYMISDTQTKIILSQECLAEKIKPYFHQSLILLDQENYREEKTTAMVVDKKPQHLAYVIYTSGTTGHPKGVMIEHTNVVNTIYHHIKMLNATTASRILQFASMLTLMFQSVKYLWHY